MNMTASTDGSGSIKMVLTKDIASKVLQKNLSELILLASQPIPNSNSTTNQFQKSACKIKIPSSTFYKNFTRSHSLLRDTISN